MSDALNNKVICFAKRKMADRRLFSNGTNAVSHKCHENGRTDYIYDLKYAKKETISRFKVGNKNKIYDSTTMHARHVHCT